MRDVDERNLAAGLAAAAEEAPEPSLDADRLLGAADRRRRRSAVLVGLAVGLAAAIVAGVATLVGVLDDTEDRAPDVTATGVAPSSAAPEPVQLPRLDEGELYVMSRAAGDLGLGQYAAVFTNLRTDDCRCSVTVFLTDLGQKGAFLAAMVAREPLINSTHVLFKQGARPRAECRSLATTIGNGLFAGGLPFRVYSVSPTIECSTIEVGVDDVRAAQAYFDGPDNRWRQEGLALTALPGEPAQAY